MIVGILKEMKNEEYRVSAPPMAVEALTGAGHRVLLQSGAGESSGFSDEEYKAAKAEIVTLAETVWKNSDMIYHVKEPVPAEYKYLREGLILFTFLHLAAAVELTRALLDRNVTSIAFETVETAEGKTPLLDPMSAIAGREAVTMGAQYLGKIYKGRGVLLGGVVGVPPANVVIIGGGSVGTNATQMALGLGARVILLDIDINHLTHLDEIMHGRFETLMSNPYNIAHAVKQADLLIGCVLIKGARAPRIVTKEMIKTMKKGSVVIDVAIDQGGCIETSHPTTHADPIFMVDDVIHYCVANMPSMYPCTSTMALSHATLPYALKLANLGLEEALKTDSSLLKGLNTYKGRLTNRSVAEALNLKYTINSKYRDI
jgi:alanine dehydrogenase